MIKELKINKERCKACGYCVRECPVKAITFSEQLNRAGYGYISVDGEKCILCGTCYVVCPDLVFEM